MTAKQVIKILQENGWFMKDQKGSHQQYFHPFKEGKVTVPVHGNKDIPPGTLASIFRQAGLKTPKA
jgi:predicted RNA binding protein YcfA (HicA-like mRNA interferase family)